MDRAARPRELVGARDCRSSAARLGVIQELREGRAMESGRCRGRRRRPREGKSGRVVSVAAPRLHGLQDRQAEALRDRQVGRDDASRIRAGPRAAGGRGAGPSSARDRGQGRVDVLVPTRLPPARTRAGDSGDRRQRPAAHRFGTFLRAQRAKPIVAVAKTLTRSHRRRKPGGRSTDPHRGRRRRTARDLARVLDRLIARRGQ